MAAAAHLYSPVYQSMLNQEINFTTGTVKAMLATSAYIPDRDGHRYKSSVTNEAVGTGYTAGGLTLASKTLTYAAGSHTWTLDCADLVWASATVQARYLIFYVSTGTDSTSPLIAYVDFGVDVTATGGSFTATIPTAGFATFTAS